jgi:hypothetical protein
MRIDSESSQAHGVLWSFAIAAVAVGSVAPHPEFSTAERGHSVARRGGCGEVAFGPRGR